MKADYWLKIRHGREHRDYANFVSAKTELQVADRKKLLQEHIDVLSSTVTYRFSTSGANADWLPGNPFLGVIPAQGLHLLSGFCGLGRLVLTGISRPDRLPSNLHALALYPFGTSGVLGLHQPFIRGRPFELACGPELPYLWVDSLCILQDDAEDWRHEASEMGVIYGRSALTITTPNNSQCDQSFSTLNEEGRDDTLLPQLPWKHRRGEVIVTGSVTVRPRVVISSGDRFPLSIEKKDSTWITRGWTLQEWLLSPRVLHCGRERVWDCYETWHTESRLKWSESTASASALDDTENVRDPGLASHVFSRMTRLDPRIREGGLDTHWARLVEDFTSRTLSHEMDKMPAIAGLATMFMKHSHAKAPGAVYLAGLWHYKGINPFAGRTYPTSQIPLGLLWAPSPRKPMRSPAEYRAPSWSWAALDGPVQSFHARWPRIDEPDMVTAFKTVRLLEVQNATCVYDPPDSCSLVKTGWIIATGLMVRAYINTSPEAMRSQFGFPERFYDNFVVLGTHQSRKETYWKGIFDQSLETTGIHHVDGSLCLLHVATITHDLKNDQIDGIINHALVVERFGSFDGIDCFRRLGVAWYSWDRNEAKKCPIPEEAELGARNILEDWETCHVRLI
ncbi:hypothetical protein DHEL01_v207964 [Diaporthe helianthi]|uniref:Heterokaryon incompatibility domain-containing protein n=1 Tax=Diaporthe helianthi TaxID=158607 RepID=A0A2P5HTQ1_DIAHE|nr:hypothetical protein DHEL01_v207964 [Diaporthe helianthi]